MEEKKKEIRISVRNLVEFILRSGDLDNSSGGFGERDAMQAGTRVHQQIQKKLSHLLFHRYPPLFSFVTLYLFSL